MTIPKFRAAVIVFLVGFALGLSVFAASRLFVVTLLDSEAIRIAESAAAALAKGETIGTEGAFAAISGYSYFDTSGTIVASAAKPGMSAPVPPGADSGRLADLARSRGAVVDEEPLLPSLFALAEPAQKRVAVPVRSGEETLGTLLVEVNQAHALQSLTRAFTIAAIVTVALAALAIILVALAVTRGAGFGRTAKGLDLHLLPRDPLTEIPSRTALAALIDDAIQRAAEADNPVLLMIVGLDGFRAVNAIWGHAAGDEVLQKAAERLRPFATGKAGVARVSGDEFAVIVEGEAAKATRRIADDIRAAMAEPFHVGDSSIVLGASLGAALYPVNADSGQFLFRAADSALAKAKAQDRRNALAVFDTEMKKELQRNAALERDMRNALANEEFVIFYQPQIDLAGGALRGYEALVRWERPGEGIIAPRDFLALAEDTGLAREIGEWVLRRACADAASWLTEGRVAINVSAAQFHDGDIDARIAAALAASGVAQERLEIEVPEAVFLGDGHAAIATLERVKALGVGVVMDDFGGRYSDLAELARFPFDKIKIDRSFVGQIAEDPDAAAIVAAIVSLGRTLSADVTAEGVETTEQLTLLKAAGCNVAQGFLFGAPRRDAGSAAAEPRKEGTTATAGE